MVCGNEELTGPEAEELEDLTKVNQKYGLTDAAFKRMTELLDRDIRSKDERKEAIDRLARDVVVGMLKYVHASEDRYFSTSLKRAIVNRATELSAHQDYAALNLQADELAPICKRLIELARIEVTFWGDDED